MKDKKVVLTIELNSDDFIVKSTIPLDKENINIKNKTLLLIALHQLKENILNDTFPKKVDGK